MDQSFRISLSDCGKSFNRTWIFRNLTAEFKSGEKWAFLGANGSGKSTLSLLLAGQVIPSEGKVTHFINGVEIAQENVFSYVSLASPAMELPEEFSIEEVLDFHSSMKPMLMSNPAETLAELCQFTPKTMKKPISSFSSGMKQRVKLCIAVFSNTPVLVLDEPLTNLDQQGEILLNNLIENYTDKRLLIIASNRMDEYKYCNLSLTIQKDASVVLNNHLTGSL